ncbi:MAG: Gfo/Idh/MocA family protein, partial [Planctomycetia bacterium]
WDDMLADKDVEAVVIATPLWTHARFAVQAMKAGKHVLCEKLMARYIGECKEMVRTSDSTKMVLSIGHQRHYSTLYDNAMQVVHSGVLGEVRHIRALWHRNNAWEYPADYSDERLRGTIKDGWNKPVPPEDQSLDAKKFDYKSVEELVRWRLYDRTGGGLMAELGSHQLDACSLFLKKVHPLTVSSVGGKFFYDDDRECEDHVYCNYEMPLTPDSHKPGVVLTYTSINTNQMQGYGEVVYGTEGTLLVLNERDVMLLKERLPGDPAPAPEMHVDVKAPALTAKNGRATLAYTKTTEISSDAALAKVALQQATWFQPPGAEKPMVNRGYWNEMEAFAYAIRNPEYKVRCDGRVALADAVMALTTNVAMRTKQRISFKKEWYDPASDEVPDGKPMPAIAARS